MFDPSELSPVAQAALLGVLAGLLATGMGPETPGALAAEVLDELLAGGRQLDLATVKTIERVDRSGIFGQDGSASAVAYVRRAANETHGWSAQRVRLGRALADQLPETLAAWHAGRIGLVQASIICGAVKSLEALLAAEIERILAAAASDISAKDLSGLAELIVAQAAPDDAAERDKQNYERQHLSTVEDAERAVEA